MGMKIDHGFTKSKGKVQNSKWRFYDLTFIHFAFCLLPFSFYTRATRVFLPLKAVPPFHELIEVVQELDPDAPSRGEGDGVPETGVVMTAVYELQSAVVDGLESVLNEDQMVPRERCEERDLLLVNAVRPGADGKPDHAGDVKRLAVEMIEGLRRRIGIGIRLKVNEELLRAVSGAEIGYAPLYLLPHGECPVTGIRPEAVVIAINASPRRDGPVPVGTGEPGVHIHLIDRKTVQILHQGAEGVITSRRLSIRNFRYFHRSVLINNMSLLRSKQVIRREPPTTHFEGRLQDLKKKA